MEVRELFNEHKDSLCRRMDRAFAVLMTLQGLFIVIFATTASPYFWDSGSLLSRRLPLAVALGITFVIVAVTLYVTLKHPGTLLSRYTIAVSQMGFASLFIHLMGGKPESHFVVFGSLAFLATYREWKLLIFSSIIIIIDHIVRGFYFPMSIYGVPYGAEWRWLEHAGWIVFENVFLIYTCVQASKEMNQIATSKKELMETRREVEKIHLRRMQFFSLISHEIRTPLNGIINFTDFLRQPASPEDHQEYVGIIKQCSDSLLRLINDLLDFSKIDSGRLEIDPHPFRAQEIQEYLESVFLFECRKKNLNFSVEIGDGVPEELIGDSHRIRQVLVNIVSNAIKFTEKGGINVRLVRPSLDNNLYRWDIEDTGIGIKKDSLGKLFSPYTQEFSSTARKYGGSGLGLAISRKLVELMGGTLDVESTQGKGSLFFFTLPLN